LGGCVEKPNFAESKGMKNVAKTGVGSENRAKNEVSQPPWDFP
jgi:hypothetical protein